MNPLPARLVALAHALEREGRYNHAKWLRAAAAALVTRDAHSRLLPTDVPTLLAESRSLEVELAAAGLQPDALAPLTLAADRLEAGDLPMYIDAPDPQVCRTCGHLHDIPETCPVCGAWRRTYQSFRPVWWLEALNPFEALTLMRATPKRIADAIAGLSGEALTRRPVDGGWSLHQVVAHLRDAQDVLAYRVNLMLEEDDPPLIPKAVWAMQGGDAKSAETTAEVLRAYRASRDQTIHTLESITLKDWWRTGRHGEFGRYDVQPSATLRPTKPRTARNLMRCWPHIETSRPAPDKRTF
jgi:hypothetical protein